MAAGSTRAGMIYMSQYEVFGGAERDRTADLVIANDALSQLSYSPAGRSKGPPFGAPASAADGVIYVPSSPLSIKLFANQPSRCSKRIAG